MDYRFEFSPTMLAQVRRVLDWLEEYSPDRVESWHQGLYEQIESLKVHPSSCPVEPELSQFGEELRLLTYGKKSGMYRILFAIEDDLIRIVAITHAARNDRNTKTD